METLKEKLQAISIPLQMQQMDLAHEKSETSYSKKGLKLTSKNVTTAMSKHKGPKLMVELADSKENGMDPNQFSTGPTAVRTQSKVWIIQPWQAYDPQSHTTS